MELKNNALFKENCLIGGKWIESNSGEKIDVDNPANGEIIGKVPKCSTSETSKAIDEAQKAFPAYILLFLHRDERPLLPFEGLIHTCCRNRAELFRLFELCLSLFSRKNK